MGYILGEPTVQQYFDANGDPLENGTIEFFIYNTSTPTPIYSNSTGTSAGTSVTLNSIGAPENGGTSIALFFDESVVYKIVRKDSAGSAIAPTIGPYYPNGGSTLTIDAVASTATDSLYDYTGTSNGDQASVAGYYVPGDGGGGMFYWNSTSTAADDGGVTILPTGHAGNGRWIRILNDVLNVRQFGAKGDGVTIDVVPIQAAIDYVDAAGGGIVTFLEGEYGVADTPIEIKSGVNLVGNGPKSMLKLTTLNDSYCLSTDSAITGCYVDNLGFNGSVGYPADSKVTPTAAPSQMGIRFRECSDITIKNCFFNSFAGSSIAFTNPVASTKEKIRITGNHFYKGSYRYKVVSVFTGSDIVISNNVSDINGPQYHWDASDPAYINSKDCFHLDDCTNAVIEGNQISNCAGIGIRIEQSIKVGVSNNLLVDIGQSAIYFYLETSECSCVGNVIRGWGKIPSVEALRTYLGTEYYATESVPVEPADPSADSRYSVWPYANDDVDPTSLVAYSAGGVANIFRGQSAIGVNHKSKRVMVTGNVCQGNQTQSGGLRVYANEFGFSPVHSVNASTTDNGEGSFVTANTFNNIWTYGIYHPKFMNPVGGTGTSSPNITYMVSYGGNTNLIEAVTYFTPITGGIDTLAIKFPATQLKSSDPNTLDTYQEGNFVTTATTTGGSMTLNTSYDKLQYTKIGRLVTCCGQLRFSAVSSPTGEIQITLPFRVITDGTAGAFASFYISAEAAITPADSYYGYIFPGNTYFTIKKMIGTSATDTAADLGTSVQLNFTFSYTAYDN